MVENAWREEYCPEYGALYCENPYTNVTCDGAWSCDDIEYISWEFVAYYDTNDNGSIDMSEYCDEEHFEILLEYCDEDGNGSIEYCEAHACIVECENAWRDAYCPEEYGFVYCPCPEPE